MVLWILALSMMLNLFKQNCESTERKIISHNEGGIRIGQNPEADSHMVEV